MKEDNKKSALAKNLKSNMHRRKNANGNMEKKHKHEALTKPRYNFSANKIIRFVQHIKIFLYKIIGKKHNYNVGTKRNYKHYRSKYRHNNKSNINKS